MGASQMLAEVVEDLPQPFAAELAHEFVADCGNRSNDPRLGYGRRRKST